ncbi:hypothetical protein ABPG72_014596 [Tetrahymena utriculariae]
MSQEQIDEVKKYLKIKDFYELLGVPKDANQEQIKKAYKKLALKFHPDKNKAEGSKEVFKKIAQAYDCLTNPDKRAVYDRYGDEEPEQHYHHYRQQFHEDISAENLFEKLFGNRNPFFQFDQASFRATGPGGAQVFYTSFGGNPMNGGMPTIFEIFNQMGQQQQRRNVQGFRQSQRNSHRDSHVSEESSEDFAHQQQQGQQQNEQNKQSQQQNKNKLFSLLQLLPLFLLFFSIFFNNLASQSPLYSMEYSKSYDLKRETKLLHINYYVAQAFVDKMRAEPTWLKEIERQIESETVQKLKEQCFQYEQTRKQLTVQLQAARSDNDKTYYNNKLNSLKNTSCSQLDKFRKDYHIDLEAVFS